MQPTSSLALVGIQLLADVKGAFGRLGLSLHRHKHPLYTHSHTSFTPCALPAFVLGIQLLADVDGSFGGLGLSLLTRIRDEMTAAPCLVLGFGTTPMLVKHCPCPHHAGAATGTCRCPPSPMPRLGHPHDTPSSLLSDLLLRLTPPLSPASP
jgi:hypothetical protein